MNKVAKSDVVKQPTPVVPAEYNQVVAAARLRDIRLIKSEFVIEADGLQFSSDWKLTHSCEIESVNLDQDRELLLVSIGAAASCKFRNKKVVSAKCRYLVAYDLNGAPEENVIQTFAKRVARFAAYPYFRSHFAEMSAQAGVHMPPLPVIKEVRLLPTATAEARKEIETQKVEEK